MFSQPEVESVRHPTFSTDPPYKGVGDVAAIAGRFVRLY
jgi:hypothetical protein